MPTKKARKKKSVGRKSYYDEPTIVYSKKVPASKIKEVAELVESFLKKYRKS